MLRAMMSLLAVVFSCSVGVAAEARPPNVLIVLADDLGFSDLGCYGGDIRTPTLDALAAGGLRFSQFYNTARCWPSRAALLTGYYAQQVRRDTVAGIPSGGRGVRPAWARLLPDYLKPLGYRSYHSGKWHVDGKPLQNGFDHSYLLQDQGRFFSPRNHSEDDKQLPAVKPDSGYYATVAIADHAIRCLKEHAEKYADRPFFHYLAFTSPHFPLQALPEDIARCRDAYRKGWDVLRRERWQGLRKLGLVHGEPPAPERDLGPPYPYPEAYKILGAGEVTLPLVWERLTEQQKEFQAAKMAIHAAMVDRMDRELGRVLEQIRAMGAFENTMILFMSDNGASAEIMVRDDGHDPAAAPGSAKSHLCLGPGWSTAANTPFRRHKTWVHEGGICTPLVIHWPAGLPKEARGQWRHCPGHLIDLVPTILELVGGQRPERWDGKPVPPPPGKSLVPVLARDGAVPRDYLWWHHEKNRAVRVGDWKLVASGKEAPWELYDLAHDRTEANNVAAAHPDKVRELDAVWKRALTEFTELARRDLK